MPYLKMINDAFAFTTKLDRDLLFRLTIKNPSLAVLLYRQKRVKWCTLFFVSLNSYLKLCKIKEKQRKNIAPRRLLT